MIPVSNERRKIILLLGNTLGNVESENSVLKNIYNSTEIGTDGKLCD